MNNARPPLFSPSLFGSPSRAPPSSLNAVVPSSHHGSAATFGYSPGHSGVSTLLPNHQVSAFFDQGQLSDNILFVNERDFFQTTTGGKLIYKLVHEEGSKKSFVRKMLTREDYAHEEFVILDQDIKAHETALSTVEEKLEFDRNDLQRQMDDLQLKMGKNRRQHEAAARAKSTIEKAIQIKMESHMVLHQISEPPKEYDKKSVDLLSKTFDMKTAPDVASSMHLGSWERITEMTKDEAYLVLCCLRENGYKENPTFGCNVRDYKKMGVINPPFTDSQVYSNYKHSKATMHGLIGIYLGKVPENLRGFNISKSNESESPWSFDANTVDGNGGGVFAVTGPGVANICATSAAAAPPANPPITTDVTANGFTFGAVSSGSTELKFADAAPPANPPDTTGGTANGFTFGAVSSGSTELKFADAASPTNPGAGFSGGAGFIFPAPESPTNFGAGPSSGAPSNFPGASLSANSKKRRRSGFGNPSSGDGNPSCRSKLG